MGTLLAIATAFYWLPSALIQAALGQTVARAGMLREPHSPKAPMHQVKRILEFASLSESEWADREAKAIAFREKNLSEWCVKGEDGVWRRKSDGQVWNSETTGEKK